MAKWLQKIRKPARSNIGKPCPVACGMSQRWTIHAAVRPVPAYWEAIGLRVPSRPRSPQALGFFRISERTTPWAATLRSPLLVGAGMVAASPAAARIGVLPTANARGRPAEDLEKSSPPAPLRAHPKLGAVGPALSNAQPFSAWDLLHPEVSCCRPADSLWSFASALCLHYIGVADERSSWPSTHRAPGTGKLFQPAQPVPVVVLRTGPGAGSGGTTPAAHPVPSESRRAGTQFQRQPGPGFPRQP